MATKSSHVVQDVIAVCHKQPDRQAKRQQSLPHPCLATSPWHKSSKGFSQAVSDLTRSSVLFPSLHTTLYDVQHVLVQCYDETLKPNTAMNTYSTLTLEQLVDIFYRYMTLNSNSSLDVLHKTLQRFSRRVHIPNHCHLLAHGDPMSCHV